jgi:hypothetical protein
MLNLVTSATQHMCHDLTACNISKNVICMLPRTVSMHSVSDMCAAAPAWHDCHQACVLIAGRLRSLGGPDLGIAAGHTALHILYSKGDTCSIPVDVVCTEFKVVQTTLQTCHAGATVRCSPSVVDVVR